MNYSKIFRKLTFIFIWIVFFLFTVEITLRILGYFYLKKDALDEISGNNKNFTILCIGDSFTYGWGVDTVDTYPKQLEKMLNNGNLNRHFKVFNVAVPGSNSSQHLQYLEYILKKYNKPNLIIILTGANDSWNLAYSNIYKFINKKNISEQIYMNFKILLSELRIYKMLKIGILNLKGKPLESEVDPFKLIPKYENIDESVLKKLLEYNLTQIVTLAKSNNVKIILQNYPRGDLYGDKITEKIALLFKVPFVDNYYAFNEKLKEASFKDLFLYDNSHPNSVGYKIMAGGLYKIIMEQVLK